MFPWIAASAFALLAMTAPTAGTDWPRNPLKKLNSRHKRRAASGEDEGRRRLRVRKGGLKALIC